MLNFDKFKIITFDCYGTLIDWETGILEVFHSILGAHNFIISDDEILESYAGIESSVQNREFQIYRNVLQDVVIEFGGKYGFTPTDSETGLLAESIKDWLPFLDAVESLEKLKEKYQLAIISNIDEDLFEGSAEHLQVEFDYIITAQQVGSYKPTLKNFHFALEKIEIPKENVLHVAQSIYHDIEPTNELGIANVWINRRARKEGGGATLDASAKPGMEFENLAEFESGINL